jgi:hypothetical protein
MDETSLDSRIGCRDPPARRPSERRGSNPLTSGGDPETTVSVRARPSLSLRLTRRPVRVRGVHNCSGERTSGPIRGPRHGRTRSCPPPRTGARCLRPRCGVVPALRRRRHRPRRGVVVGRHLTADRGRSRTRTPLSTPTSTRIRSGSSPRRGGTRGATSKPAESHGTTGRRRSRTSRSRRRPRASKSLTSASVVDGSANALGRRLAQCSDSIGVSSTSESS